MSSPSPQFGPTQAPLLRPSVDDLWLCQNITAQELATGRGRDAVVDLLSQDPYDFTWNNPGVLWNALRANPEVGPARLWNLGLDLALQTGPRREANVDLLLAQLCPAVSADEALARQVLEHFAQFGEPDNPYLPVGWVWTQFVSMLAAHMSGATGYTTGFQEPAGTDHEAALAASGRNREIWAHVNATAPLPALTWLRSASAYGQLERVMDVLLFSRWAYQWPQLTSLGILRLADARSDAPASAALLEGAVRAHPSSAHAMAAFALNQLQPHDSVNDAIEFLGDLRNYSTRPGSPAEAAEPGTRTPTSPGRAR